MDNQETIDCDLKASNKRFIEHFLPQLQNRFPRTFGKPKDWINIEFLGNVNGGMLQQIDRSTGIDFIQKTHGYFRTWSIRSCFVKKEPYNSFTIRYEKDSVGDRTEYEKHIEKIEHHCMKPDIHIHIEYDKDNKIVSCAWSALEDLMEVAKDRNKCPIRTNKKDGTKFIVVPYNEVKTLGNILGKKALEKAVKDAQKM